MICLSNHILPPRPLSDIQINTLPLAFVLFTLLPVFWGSLVCCSHLSRIPLLLVLLSLLLILFFSFLLLSCSPLVPHLPLFFLLLPASSMSAGVSVLRSKILPRKKIVKLNNGNNCCHWGRDSLLGILGYNSLKERGKSSVMGWQEWEGHLQILSSLCKGQTLALQTSAADMYSCCFLVMTCKHMATTHWRTRTKSFRVTDEVLFFSERKKLLDCYLQKWLL